MVCCDGDALSWLLTLQSSTYIYFEEREYATRGSLHVYVGSVPTEHLDTFDHRLQESFKRVASSGIDMKRLSMVLDRDQRQLRSKLESSQGDTFSGTVINDALYGAEDGSELAPGLDEMKRYEELRKWTSEDWVNLLKKYVSVLDCVRPKHSLC